jgi:inorganic pyrophosphatase
MPPDPHEREKMIERDARRLIVLVEAAAGTRTKHQFDESTYVQLGVKQVPSPYPYHYGFVPGTQGTDGESLDAYILTRVHADPGDRINCSLVGLFEFWENGEADHKLLCVCEDDCVTPRAGLEEELTEFTKAIFAPFPWAQIRPGTIRNQEVAEQFLGRAKL